MVDYEPMSEADEVIVAEQLGRMPRGIAGIGWRCPCGKPGVIVTYPQLDDGTPFPTTFYLTHPSAVTACSRLEASGIMAELTQRVQTDPELAAAYQRAHEAYLAARRELGDDSIFGDFSAGGMPDRVKCLHALVGHALAAGPGVNPIGDEMLAEMGEFWSECCQRS